MLEQGSRRNFFVLSIQGLGAIIGAALGLPALAYLFAPSKLKAQQDTWIDVGEVARLPAGGPAEVLFRRKRVDGWKVIDEKTSAWVVRTGDSTAFALAPGCTHLGCAYRWLSDKNEFLCPCHTSTFDLEGKVTSGPAPRPLDRYESRVVNGRLQVGQIVKFEG